ncbi:MAG: hypothetical protein JWN94_3772 [Betaproteobacteria bacterium]|nr:hypothetical protein [Betaproteobacteria bacterium]
MKRLAAGIALALLAESAAAYDIFTVAPDLWDRPRSARAVLEQSAVRQAISQYLAEPAAQLVIHHGYGQDPLLQAEELRMWLMTLAVDGARISLINDVRPHEPLKIEVVK